MIVDTSALVAVIAQEADAAVYERVLAEADVVRISAGTVLEASIVIDGRGDAVLGRRLADLLRVIRAGIEPVTEDQARIARDAYRDFGRGSGHPARLNFGDCFAYALAKDTGEPLLYKGDDFVHTDVIAAVPR